MAISFPPNPTDGQVHAGYYYDLAKTAWRSLPLTQAQSTSSSTPPLTAKPGEFWYNTNDGVLFTYFDDGNSSQWVEVKANSALGSTIANRVDALETGKANLTGGNTFAGTQIFGTPVDVSSGGTGATSASSARANLGAAQQTANYSMSNSVAVTVNTTTPTTVASMNMTTNGRPVLLTGGGDMNPAASGNWHWFQIYRGSTALGKIYLGQTAGASYNLPFWTTVIDTPPAGTYNYTLKVWQGSGSITYGENGDSNAPTLIGVELF